MHVSGFENASLAMRLIKIENDWTRMRRHRFRKYLRRKLPQLEKWETNDQHVVSLQCKKKFSEIRHKLQEGSTLFPGFWSWALTRFNWEMPLKNKFKKQLSCCKPIAASVFLAKLGVLAGVSPDLSEVFWTEEALVDTTAA